MIKYFHGEKYGHHCSGVERMAVVLITCDPGEQTVSFSTYTYRKLHHKQKVNFITEQLDSCSPYIYM